MFKIESYITPLLMGYIDKYVKLKKEDFQVRNLEGIFRVFIWNNKSWPSHFTFTYEIRKFGSSDKWSITLIN